MLNKNQKLFFSHLLLREFFFGIGQLGWVYLYLQGVNIVTIFIALLSFRLVQNIVFTPVAYFLFRRFTFKPIMLLGIVLQAAFMASFYFAAQNWLFLIGTVILMASYDSIYHSARTNLERLLSSSNDIARNVSLSYSVGIIANALGIIFIAYGLSFSASVTFLITVSGMLISFIPISFLKLYIPISKNTKGVLNVLFFNQSLKTFFKSRIVWIVLIMALISEFIQSTVPVFLVHLEITIIGIGLLFGIMRLLSLIVSIVVGFFEKQNKNHAVTFFGITTAILLAIFIFLPAGYLAYFALIYGVIGVGWEISIDSFNQRFCHKHWPCTNGGILNQWLDNIGRNLLYPFILLFIIISNDTTHFLQITFIFLLCLMVIGLFISGHARRELS